MDTIVIYSPAPGPATGLIFLGSEFDSGFASAHVLSNANITTMPSAGDTVVISFGWYGTRTISSVVVRNSGGSTVATAASRSATATSTENAALYDVVWPATGHDILITTSAGGNSMAIYAFSVGAATFSTGAQNPTAGSGGAPGNHVLNLTPSADDIVIASMHGNATASTATIAVGYDDLRELEGSDGRRCFAASDNSAVGGATAYEITDVGAFKTISGAIGAWN